MEAKPIEETRLSHLLSVQSHQIEIVMSHHQIPATVTGGKVNRHTVSYDLQTQFTSGLDKIRGLFEDLKSALGGGQPSLTNESGNWELKIKRQAEPAVSLLKLLAADSTFPPLTTAIGMADANQPVLLRFGPKHVHHVLVAGDSRAGKTTLLRSIAVGLARTNRQSRLQIMVLNPNGLDNKIEQPLRPLTWLPHMMTDPSIDIESSQALLHFLAEEMEYRRQARIRQPMIVTLIDHLVTLLEQSRQAGQDIIRLLQHGPQTGIHLVMATRRPDSVLLDTAYRTNISLRLVGKFEPNDNPRRVAGITVQQSNVLFGAGDFLALSGDTLTYFQAAAIDDYDLHLTLTEMIRPSMPRLLARPFNPRLQQATESDQNGSNQPQTFTHQNGTITLTRTSESGKQAAADQASR
jgi:hypothetical protein